MKKITNTILASTFVFISLSNIANAQIVFDLKKANSISVKNVVGQLLNTHHFKLSNDGTQIYDFFDSTTKVVLNFSKTNIPQTADYKTLKYPLISLGNQSPKILKRAKLFIDNDLVLLKTSDSSKTIMEAYDVYDMQKKKNVLSIIFQKNSENYTGKINSFKRKGDSTVLITAIYENKITKFLLIKTWLLTPDILEGSGWAIPSILTPEGDSKELLFSYQLNYASGITSCFVDCNSDGSYATLGYNLGKNTMLSIWNGNNKTWRDIDYAYSKIYSNAVKELMFNNDGYVMVVVAELNWKLYIINPITLETVFTQLLTISRYSNEPWFDFWISNSGALYAVNDVDGFILFKTKTNEKLFRINNDEYHDENYAAYQAKAVGVVSPRIEGIDVTPDFKYVTVLTNYSDLVDVQNTRTLTPIDIRFDMYDLTTEMVWVETGVRKRKKVLYGRVPLLQPGLGFLKLTK